MTKLTVHLAKLGNGRFAAASMVSPFFCFEAETEEAVMQKVTQALVFYRKAKMKMYVQ